MIRKSQNMTLNSIAPPPNNTKSKIENEVFFVRERERLL
jgi:hypothetical protein